MNGGLWRSTLARVEHWQRLRAIKSKAWRGCHVPEAADAPTMLIPDERRLLFYLASKYYTGRGAIIDGGCFLGGSTTALAAGLEAWLERSGTPALPGIHSYDLFEVEPWTIGMYFPPET